MKKTLKKMKAMLRPLLLRKHGYDVYLEGLQKSAVIKEMNMTDKGTLCIVLSGHKYPVFARKYPHSDINVLEQVFIDKEYKPLVDYILDNFSEQQDLKIIDAGSNVGYFSLFVKEFFTTARIACIEPDKENMAVLTQNLQPFIDKQEVKTYRNGLAPASDVFLNIDNGFRGGKDWSFTVVESAVPTELKSITIYDVMKNNQWDELDILKMDIEGSERFIFGPGMDLSFLNVTKLIAIEIHDEFKIRHSIYKILRANHFLILNFEGTTLAINKKYIPADQVMGKGAGYTTSALGRVSI